MSDDIIKAIEEYASFYTTAARFMNNLEYKNKVVSIDELNELLYERYDNKPLFERVDLIAEKINNTYFRGTAKDLISITSGLYKIANFKKDYKEIYKGFFESAPFYNAYPNMFRKNENINI